MILERYRQIKEIVDNEYRDIIEDIEIIFSYTGRARKLRLNLNDRVKVQIRVTEKERWIICLILLKLNMLEIIK